MGTFLEKFCQADLIQRKQEQNFRFLRPFHENRSLILKDKENSYINFSSNDYLGLRAHPSVIETSNQFTHQYGAGAGASGGERTSGGASRHDGARLGGR